MPFHSQALSLQPVSSFIHLVLIPVFTKHMPLHSSAFSHAIICVWRFGFQWPWFRGLQWCCVAPVTYFQTFWSRGPWTCDCDRTWCQRTKDELLPSRLSAAMCLCVLEWRYSHLIGYNHICIQCLSNLYVSLYEGTRLCPFKYFHCLSHSIPVCLHLFLSVSKFLVEVRVAKVGCNLSLEHWWRYQCSQRSYFPTQSLYRAWTFPRRPSAEIHHASFLPSPNLTRAVFPRVLATTLQFPLGGCKTIRQSHGFEWRCSGVRFRGL